MDLTNFKEIPKYPEYLVSKDAEVFSTKSNRLLTPYDNGSGYLIVCFTYNKVRHQKLLSRVVASTWLGMDLDDNTKEVDHKDRNTLNNCSNNLQVLSIEEHLKKTIFDKGQQLREGTKICSCGSKKELMAIKCHKCTTKEKFLLYPDITAEQIEYWVQNFSWTRAAKELGLTDNGLRKRYIRLTGKDPKSIKK